jgi:hypothetical protein
MPNPITAGDQFLEIISGQLAQQNELLSELVGILRPEPPAEPAPADDKPEPKAPAKKAATRRRVTGQ